MKQAFACLLLVTLLAACSNKTKTGTIQKYPAFPSQFVQTRNVEVYLPPGYSENKKYDVLYVHDGQNVFDKTTAFSGAEWEIDERVTSLLNSDSIRPVIVVAVWNSAKRFEEYMPAKPAEAVKQALLTDSIHKGKELISDAYLKFLVYELKPFVDREFSTYTTPDHTWIMGSSMGGLISCYAVNEYPQVFGGAACISTHWPALKGAYLQQLMRGVPDPATHRFYFDHGTAGLDSLYAPYQLRADSIFAAAGYRRNENWLSLQFEGAAHNEAAWQQRIDQPLKFLLKK
ncbi:MAG: alpha/beta hydrolase [Chitinophagaceae bacterium]|nr:alpha/beta hydrolase [Chitinophagaceae bacterium]